MNSIAEFFGRAPASQGADWPQVVLGQQCPFLGKTCTKVRKSDPETAIGTCTIQYGKEQKSVIICPIRLSERRQVFLDCLHLLTTHEPGNELHLIPEVAVPGGSVDYFLVSARNEKVKDFVGIELQAVDTTGTIWPERQRLLRKLGVIPDDEELLTKKTFGINWKMTAKTTLVQLHHKIDTFEHVNKKLVLVVQDRMLTYMQQQFRFDHMSSPPKIGDSMHIHAYHLEQVVGGAYKLALQSRLSTDAAGVGLCLGLQAEKRIELEQLLLSLEARLSTATLFAPRF